MLCRGTTRSTHDYDWKKGLLPGSFTWPLKKRTTNQHFSRARKLEKLNYIQFHGYVHMSSAISRMFPSSCLGGVSEMFKAFLSTVWQARKNSAPKNFNFVSILMDILKKLDPGIYWPTRYFWCQPRSSRNFWTSEETTNPEIAELQWSVRWHNQDTTDAGKWGMYWDSGTKTLWMRHS